MKIKFQVGLTTLLLALLLFFGAVILWMVDAEGQRVARERAGQRFEEKAQWAREGIDSLLNGALALAVTLEDMGRYASPGQPLPVPGGALDDPRIGSWLQALASDPVLYSVYLGAADGGFMQLVSLPEGSGLHETLGAPATARFVLRVIDQVDGGRLQKQFLDDHGQPLALSPVEPFPYDPRQRPWFGQALNSNAPILTAPYVFTSTGGLGITTASQSAEGSVLGVDITLDALVLRFSQRRASPSAAAYLLDEQGRILAHSGDWEGEAIGPLSPLNAVADSSANRLAKLFGERDNQLQIATLEEGETWLLRAIPVGDYAGRSFHIAISAPLADFSAGIIAMMDRIKWFIIIASLIGLPLLAWMARSMSQRLLSLAREAERLGRFDFSENRLSQDSGLHEISILHHTLDMLRRHLSDRTEALKTALAKLEKLVELAINLSAEQDLEALLRMSMLGAKELTQADAVTLFMLTEDGRSLRFAMRSKADELPNITIPLFDETTGEPRHQNIVTHVVISGETAVIDDVYQERRFDVSGTRAFDAQSGYRTVSMLTVPLKNNAGKVMGAIQLLNALDERGGIVPFTPDIVRFVEALASQAAIAITNQDLLAGQKKLMESFIQVIADSIDAKSLHTGGHCSRVPELGRMLVQAAHDAEAGPFADFSMADEDAWREFRIGAWLHDCGKVVTPEHVVEKGSKLETLYNRFHEIRTRFEVLRRDVVIDYLEKRVEGTEDSALLASRRDAALEQLDADFHFLAQSNVGGEYLDEEAVARIRGIGQRRWIRYFSDREGLSPQEEMHLAAHPPASLPAEERLLADKPWHIHPRPESRRDDRALGLRMPAPENLLDLGEITNLCIPRGTLTPEERYIIQEHVVHTMTMLSALPLPESLSQVPEIAATHHETMIGSGYPRGLSKGDLSVPARIMAIADVFEALTAADRPYKQPKKLSEALRIMSFMVKDQHIDADLFRLFLTSNVYRIYAEQFLRPDQLDEVDVAAMM